MSYDMSSVKNYAPLLRPSNIGGLFKDL